MESWRSGFLLKIEQNRAEWELDLLKTAQQAVLSRTRRAAPEQYEVCKKANAGSGRAFPDGFTIDLTTDGENTKTVSLPLGVHADLTSNPKEFPHFPNLESHLDAVVTPDGKFIVKDFHLASPKKSISGEAQNILAPDDQDSEERYYGPHKKP